MCHRRVAGRRCFRSSVHMIDASRRNHALAPQLTRRSASWVATRRRQDELGSIGLFPFAGVMRKRYRAQTARGRPVSHTCPLADRGRKGTVDGRDNEHDG